MPLKYEKLTFIISPRETCDAECADNLAAYIWCLCLAIVTVSCFPGIHVELSGRLRNYGTWFSSVVPVHSEVLTYRSDVAIVIESVFGEKGICQL